MTDNEKQEVFKAYRSGVSWKQIFEMFPDIARETLRSTIRRSPEYIEKHTHHDITIEKTPNIDPNQFLDNIIAWQKEVKSFESNKIEITYDIPSEYIAIVNWADHHTGALDVNYTKLKEDFELIKKTPNLYAVMDGDMMNNFIEGTPKGGGFEEIFSPKMAKALIKMIVEELAGKWLAVVSGDHDNWSFIMDDFKPAEYFAIHGKTVFFDWGGIINLKGDSFTYKIAVRHRYVGNSRKNISNAHSNAWAETEADIVMLAHTHKNMAHQEDIPGNRLKIFLNSGTYKNSDNFGRKLGYDASSCLFPAVVLSRKVKKAWAFNDFRDAIEFMENKY